MSDEKIKGKVKWFDSKKGYGFIESEGEKDIFVHFSEIIQEGYKALKDGEEVARYQANIMMVMETTKGEIQGKIDEILMESF